MRASRGRSSETSFRLCSRAPRMISWSATVVLVSAACRSRTSVRLGGAVSQFDAPFHTLTRHRQRSCRSPGRVDGTMGGVTDVLRADPGLIARADRALVRTVDAL